MTTTSPSLSPVTRHAGMGAIVHDSGVAFRVWAPNATSVSVIGTFNHFNAQSHPMEREESGNWYLDIPEAKVGDEYKYSIVNGEQVLERIDPRAREVTNSVGNGIVHDPSFDWEGDDFELAPQNELVIYEMHVGTFNRIDKDTPGTFEDITKKLNYLRRLGVNALQLMPCAEFAGDVSWGYNPAHIYAIESAYGGPEGFKQFVKLAHQKGFGVLLDVVYNHFGPSDLDLWRFDGWSENDLGGIYFYNDYRSDTPWGDTRPDYGRGEVRSFIRDNALMWFEDYHVDGLRYDMTLYIRSVDGSPSSEIPDGWSLAQWINREIRERHPGAITIAEDLQNNAYLTKPEWEGGAAFSSQWDAGFVHPVRDVITQPNDDSRCMAKIYGAIAHSYNHSPFQRVIYTESHDEVANGKARVPAEIDDDNSEGLFAQKRSTMGAALVFTAPGIPMLFQGQEFLQGGWFQDTQELDWDNRSEHKGIVWLYADLIRLRLNQSDQTRGLTGDGTHVFHLNQRDKVVAFHRYCDHGPGDDVVIVMNFANRAWDHYQIGFPCGGTWRLRFNSDWSGYSELFQDSPSQDVAAESIPYDGLSASASVKIGPYSVLIYSQDRPDEVAAE
jgi:1,4-alpha-glucan branching enzyme